MTVSFSENFLKIFSTDEVFSLDDLNDNFLEPFEVCEPPGVIQVPYWQQDV